MLKFLLNLIVGNKHERDIVKLRPLAEKVTQLEDGMRSLTDNELLQKTGLFRSRLAGGESLDDILPESFAVVREASRRALHMRHFDVQIIGGIVLHHGKIAEMVTGEGKTLVATLSAYLNALKGDGVHIITVNDYLAKRDRDWMGPLFEFLGLSVGVIQHDMTQEARQRAYGCDITYGTNNEFGFDYLRDNMVFQKEHKAQKKLNYAIVDEVDSILIDEARTPLIISGPVDTVTHCNKEVKPLVVDMMRKQEMVITKKIDELNMAIKENKDDIIKQLLFTVHRGSPKDKRFLTLILGDASYKKKLDDSTLFYGSKGMENDKANLEKDLFFTYEERTKDIVFTPKGEDELSRKYPGQFHLEDIDDVIFNIQNDTNLSAEQKIEKERDAYRKYEEKSRRLNSLETMLKVGIIFHKDTDYVVQDNKVVIVDEFTGRMMPGRRFSDGIHEALEAKENVTIQKESQTLATITFQNYFRMYGKLSGMTGTADTEASEFREIYKLDVVVIPTNVPLARTNKPDVIYKTEKEKFNAVLSDIVECYKAGRPVLLGTTSIEKSERFARMLKNQGVTHEVLNAKHHAREAEIIKLAGQNGAITIATNMAGRGTDIVLGEGIPDIGGLHVIGTERHESRRIDNQLRGRAGRQGDPGSSRFYLSLEDDLMRIFGSDRITTIMEKLGMEEGQDIQHPLITRAIATAQKRVETHNFEIRKQLLKYDDIMNKQRTVIYERRNEVLYADDLEEYIFEVIDDVVDEHIGEYIFTDRPGEWDIAGLNRWMQMSFLFKIKEDKFEGLKSPDDVKLLAVKAMRDNYRLREGLIGKEQLTDITRYMILSAIDHKWKDHLYAMDNLREAVGFRAYGQKDPLIEYQHEGFGMFSSMISRINDEILDYLYKMQFVQREYRSSPEPGALDFSHPSQASSMSVMPAGDSQNTAGPSMARQPPRPSAPIKRDTPKVGRNDPCPCGSGSKYKKCCGK